MNSSSYSILKVEFIIAWRYLRAKRREKFISAIGFFSLVGIALGVATLIIVTSVMNGFHKEFMDRVIGFNGHITMTFSQNTPDYAEIARKIRKIPAVVQAIPVIERQGLISNGDSVQGTLCQGIRQEDLERKQLISENIVRGSLENFKEEDSIILGDSLAQKSRLNIGSDVVMIVPKIDETGLGFVPRKKTFRLAATFKSGMHEYDTSVSFVPLKMAQKLFKIHNSVGAISIFLNDPMKIPEVFAEISRNYRDRAYLTDWQQSNSAFMRAVDVERNVMFLILTLITLVASFNIISCMIMMVKDKEKDIAILRTIGMARKSIMRIFFIVGASIGVLGTIVGTALGLLFSMNIEKIQAVVEKIAGTSVFSPEVYFLTQLPSLLQTKDVLMTVAVALVLSCLSTFYPARRASKVEPTEILRWG